jgi:hypothetical protein
VSYIFLALHKKVSYNVVWSGSLDQCCRLPAKHFIDQGQSRSFLDIPGPANQHRPLPRGVQHPAVEAEVRSVPAETHPSQHPRPPLGWVISLVPPPPPLLRRLPLPTPPLTLPFSPRKSPLPSLAALRPCSSFPSSCPGRLHL